MKILITNSVLLGRSGTEIFVAQLAGELRDRGHEVMLYSPRIGPFGEALRRSGHLVIEHIADIAMTPDVIHAHHVGPALTVFTAFPATPAVFLSHSVESEFDAMPRHGSVVRYLAVSNHVRAQRAKSWLPMEQIHLLRNAVDLPGFPARLALPDRPKSALAVVKYRPGVEMIRQFCLAAGIQLDVVGDGVGNIIDDLPARMQRVDLVFATGRSALEALAVGCAVLLTDGGMTGGLIRSDRIEGLLDYNLGVHALSHRLTPEALRAALAAYDSGDARQVSVYTRENASLAGQADRLLEIYAAAIEQGVAPEDRMKMATLIESYVPNHGLLPWRQLVTDYLDTATQTRLKFASDPMRYTVSEEEGERHAALERALAAEQESTAERANASARAQAEQARTLARADAAESALAATLSSTSWRAMAWLRWLGNKVKGR